MSHQPGCHDKVFGSFTKENTPTVMWVSTALTAFNQSPRERHFLRNIKMVLIPAHLTAESFWWWQYCIRYSHPTPTHPFLNLEPQYLSRDNLVLNKSTQHLQTSHLQFSCWHELDGTNRSLVSLKDVNRGVSSLTQVIDVNLASCRSHGCRGAIWHDVDAGQGALCINHLDDPESSPQNKYSSTRDKQHWQCDALYRNKVPRNLLLQHSQPLLLWHMQSPYRSASSWNFMSCTDSNSSVTVWHWEHNKYMS